MEIDCVASELANWAIKEMGFSKSDENLALSETNTSLDLEGICLGPLADVWSYIIKHVRSESTVQVIKGNLKLYSKTQVEDSKKLELVKERDKLRQEVAELKKSTQILQESVNETKMAAQEQAKDLTSQEMVFRDLERSAFILRSVKTKEQDEKKVLNQTTTMLEKNFQALAPHLERETDIDRFKIDLELMCKQMQNSLDELMNQEPNMGKIQAIKKDVGKTLATMLETLPRHLFLQLIQEQQEKDMLQWAKMENSAQTPHHLDFVPEDLQPLQKLLYELSWFYTDSRFKAQKAKKQAAELKKELNFLQLEANEQLTARFHGDERVLNAALQLAQTQVQVSSRKAAIESLRKTLDELEKYCQNSEARKADIQRKIRIIESNSQLAEHLSSLICTLARKHTENPQAIKQSVARLQNIANQEFKAVHDLLISDIKLSKGNVEKEMELFKQLKPSQLFHTSLERKQIDGIETASQQLFPVNRLAMHRFTSLPLTAEANSSACHLESTLKHLGLHRGLPVFYVFETIGEKRAKMQRTRQAIKWHETRQSEIAEQYGQNWLNHAASHFKNLSATLKTKRKCQEAEILPTLDSRIKTMDEAAQLTNDVQKALNEWCDEPAKLIDTGRKVNGLTLEQWRQQWNKSLTLCRKK